MKSFIRKIKRKVFGFFSPETTTKWINEIKEIEQFLSIPEWDQKENSTTNSTTETTITIDPSGEWITTYRSGNMILHDDNEYATTNYSTDWVTTQPNPQLVIDTNGDILIEYDHNLYTFLICGDGNIKLVLRSNLN